MKLTLCALTLASIVCIAGCGDDDDSNTAPADAATTDTVADTAQGDALETDAAVVQDVVEAGDAIVDVSDDSGSPPTDTALGDGSADDATNVEVSPDTTSDTAVVDIVAPMDTSNDTAVIEDTAASAISFATVYDALFAGPYNCSSGYCHGSGAGGLTVTDETGTHFALANQNAVNPICGLTKLVVPGDPEQSLLWRRVRPSAEDAGDPCAPPKMPDGSDGVDAATADLVYSWIADGALP